MPSPSKLSQGHKSPRSPHTSHSSKSKKYNKNSDPEWYDESRYMKKKSPIQREIEHEVMHDDDDMEPEKSRPNHKHRRSHGSSGGDDHDDPPSGDEEDSEDNGTDDYSGSEDESSVGSGDDESEADEDMAAEAEAAVRTPTKLQRSESVRVKQEIDRVIIDLAGDDQAELEEKLALIQERVKVMKAKVNAENLFVLGEETMHEVEMRITESIKFAVKNELWNLVTKGSQLATRRELLRDRVTKHQCLDQFFERNHISHSLKNVVSSAAKKVMNFVSDEDALRSETFGAFLESNGNFKMTPRKANAMKKQEAAEETMTRSRGRPRKRSHDIEEYTTVVLHNDEHVKQPGQPVRHKKHKKRKHSSDKGRPRQ